MKRKVTVAGKTLVSEDEVSKALTKANVPYQFRRPEASMLTYPWGERMAEWSRTLLMDAVCTCNVYLSGGRAGEWFNACALLTRALVLRNQPAVFYTLPELMDLIMDRERELPTQGFMVVAGFHDVGSAPPFTPTEFYRAAWHLQRVSKENLTVVAQASTGGTKSGVWWPQSLLGTFGKDLSFSFDA